MPGESTGQDYESWITKAEREATANPAKYRRKVGMLAALGYVYVFALLALALAGVAAVLAALLSHHTSGGNYILLKIAFLLLVFSWTVLSALWVKFEEPQGTPVTPAQYPKLTAEIAELQRRLDTIPIHRTIIVPELNAFVSQTPRLGILGWQRNTLALGFDLMLALSRDEMRAVIAHELGHLSGNHSRFAGWIYRVRRTWSNLFTKFNERGGFGAAIINRFFRWYVPRFDAYSFALRRQNEYEADAAAAELTSPETAGAALVRFNIINGYMSERYWPRFHGEADCRAEPSRMAHAAMSEDLRALMLAPDETARYRAMALAERAGFEDTHPSLSDRLRGLGLDPKTFEPAAGAGRTSAAIEWLGDELPHLIEAYDRDWWQANTEGWAERHATAVDEKAQLDALSIRPSGSLEQMQQWQLATLTSRYIGEPQALPIFRDYQARFPDDFDAAVVVANLLRNAGNPECLAEWMSVPRHHPTFVLALSEAASYLELQGDTVEAERLRSLARERAIELEAARAEISEVGAGDKLQAPTPAPAILASLLASLKEIGGIDAAWLTEKAAKHDHGMPIYVLAFRSGKRYSAKAARAARLQAVFEAFADTAARQEPFHLFVIEIDRKLIQRGIAGRVRRAGTRIL